MKIYANQHELSLLIIGLRSYYHTDRTKSVLQAKLLKQLERELLNKYGAVVPE